MLDSIITSKTRVKLLMRLFLNSNNTGYLRGFEKEFSESSNSIRHELNRLTEAGLLESEYTDKNTRVYKANTKHPLYNDINSILRKVVGIDKIVDKVTSQIGNLESAYVTGKFAAGTDSDTVELVLIGENLDETYIKSLIEKAEKLINRKIMHLVLTKVQMDHFFKDEPVLLIWQRDELPA
ncbi:MAG TPA: hypothetical protein VKA38_08480 [Draconibacterium sp.]|nr:hypothetical protein [Draconibacterium sp.]